MTKDYDPHATTGLLRAISHDDAVELKRLTENERRAAISWVRRELMYTISMVALGMLAALGIWKLVELIAFYVSRPHG